MLVSWVGFVILSWLAADFVSGFFHWLEDRYFDKDWPIVGKYIATPNQEHHARPQAFLSGSYWYRNWTTIVPALAGLAVCLLVPSLHCGWLTCLFLTQANELHAWSHQHGHLTKPIVLIQETGVVQSCRHHAEHHRSPHEVRYCVMSNWLNPFLDCVGFWYACERVLACVGIRVREINHAS
jgi:ubiquitin-conjugating enzyme E2 variant